MSKKELGVYIHIPFCKRKCYYCDFISYPNKIESAKKYIDCVKKEIDQFDFSNYNITTIYIGGGTPSYINEVYIKELLEKLTKKLENNENNLESNKNNLKYNENNLKSNRNNLENLEITIEVNPGTVTKEKLELYKKCGVNRLSIGLQSAQNRLLKEIGRIHTLEEFLETYKMAKEVGFDNINVDLMIGLPNQTIQDIKESLEQLIKLDPTHISVYSLIVEEGTAIEKKIEDGSLKLPEEELERRMYWYVKNYLELHGYNQYEISNFAKKGYESKHNLNCWNQEEYIGFGIAAHSYIKNIRFGNTENLEKYIENIEAEKTELNKNIEEKQTKEDQEKEFMMLGFRKIQGINIAKFKEKFTDNPLFLYNKQLNKLSEEGLIEVDLNFIRLTSKGLDLANLVFEEFV